MEKQKFKLIGFLIIGMILLTVFIQLYRNIQIYNTVKDQIRKEVQLSFDNSVEEYYADKAKDDIFHIFGDEPIIEIDSVSLINYDVKGKSIGDFKLVEKGNGNIKMSNWVMPKSDSFALNDKEKLSESEFVIDSIFNLKDHDIDHISVIEQEFSLDSMHQIKDLTKKIIISIVQDSIDFNLLQNILTKEFGRRDLELDYSLLHYKNDQLLGELSNSEVSIKGDTLVAQSTFLPGNQYVSMVFNTKPIHVFKRGLVEFAVSLVFVIVIFWILLYLYRVIKQQKELSEIKNDLISNITHEFKTPIATVLSALEGIEKFNKTNDPEKTRKYLGISNVQLKKLNSMVEKLLETATLDSEELEMKKENVDPSEILFYLKEKYEAVALDKKVILELPEQVEIMNVDPFHFENAISNLLDNAIKYGGDEIRLVLTQRLGYHEILVTDNGGGLDSSHKEKIFEKFYRVPKGNLHDVKGFGIGLYYVKKIIAKHGGEIELITKANRTDFKIKLS
ncbi:sensor histidine kinase [Marinigracilibium pacificum]|uniref:histidine kinase n=1 Tax=Marinigracilibium pacificum TaxID=2729599 RepID=A0A848J516_9BACT|nr:HAMP domain-containing sensor histidine kinase [Marinigracilibium pacificum]NMM50871.1 HAMP domain-containing histidine kinase [Marinigracilibium pacificum]